VKQSAEQAARQDSEFCKCFNAYMLLTGREVRIGETVPEVLNRGHIFPYTERPRPVNNVSIFFCFFGGGTRRIGLRIVRKQSFYMR